MNSVFSVDDFSDPFWSSPSSSPGPVPVHLAMNRSQSEWALEKFFEEVNASPGAISVSSVGDNAISLPPVAVRPEVSQPSVSRTDEDVVEINKPQHCRAAHRPLDPSPAAQAYMDEHTYLKNRLDLACAAVALRVSLSF